VREQLRWVAREVLDALVALAFVWWIWRQPDWLYTRWVVEDGRLEWLQVGALVVVLAACVVAAARARGRRWLVWAGAAIVMLVAVGEELAWGSRLLSLSVDAVQSSNVQGDLTLHNLGGLRGLSKTFAAVSLLGLVGALGCLAWRWRGRPRVGLAVWFGLPAVYAAMRVLDNDPITSRFAKLSEVLELVLYVALARVAVRAAAAVAATRSTTPQPQVVEPDVRIPSLP
jgi:hypothetical protein